MSIEKLVANEMRRDESSVWVLPGHAPFAYSEGRAAEQYLERVIRASTDLSTTSRELEGHIRDWPTEYHLSPKRSQLLAGFDFERSMSVLEVGCGCGAITRLLGERFDDVVSVEGSLPRARIARYRTRDQPGVTVVCAPFQALEFKRRFDAIFCIGVFEYSGAYLDGEDPYEAALARFGELLTPEGALVLAIENQFGLKYFAGQDEDHLGMPYKGIEGYPDRPTTVRTFGMQELEARLRRRFSEIRFFYPQPDYKLPDCVLSHEFLAGEEAANMSAEMASRSSSYMIERRPSFDVAAATRALAKNGMLPFFANSFLAVAGKREIRGIEFDQLAFLVSPGRRPEFRTETRIAIDTAGRLIAAKSIPGGAPYVREGRVTLKSCASPWAGPRSIHAEALARCKESRRTLAEIFAPCGPWADLLREASFDGGGRRMLEGGFIDCTWDNVFPSDDGPVFIDREWIWSEPIALEVVVIRAIYCFLLRIDIEGESGLSGQVRRSRGKALIRDIAEVLGFQPSRRDFAEFAILETDFQCTVFGMSPIRYGTLLRWLLIDRRSLRAIRRVRTALRRVGAAVRYRLGRVLRG